MLAGSEVNVHPDGSLDYDDDLLEQLDWVVASMHTSFRMREKELTERMIAAMEHPLVDAIGHPTGRLIDRREPYALDIERVVEAAIRTGTFLEINANPDRRDLNELNARLAAEAGAMLVIDSDAHGVDTLGNIRYGVATARRALGRSRSGGEHALVGRARSSAEALAWVIGSTRRKPGVRIRLRRLERRRSARRRSARRRAPRSPRPPADCLRHASAAAIT